MIYRVLSDLDPRPNSEEPAALAGQLLFPWRASRPNDIPGGTVPLTVRPDGWGGMILAPHDRMERVDQPKAAELPQLLEFYLSGGAQIPNFEPGTPEKLELHLDNMACSAGMTVRAGVCNIRLPKADSNISGHQVTTWARAFLGMTQGGSLDGTGMLLLYCGFGNPDRLRTATFAICKHEVVKGANARPERGWHPAHCSKCGMDLTVDSGD